MPSESAVDIPLTALPAEIQRPIIVALATHSWYRFAGPPQRLGIGFCGKLQGSSSRFLSGDEKGSDRRDLVWFRGTSRKNVVLEVETTRNFSSSYFGLRAASVTITDPFFSYFRVLVSTFHIPT